MQPRLWEGLPAAVGAGSLWLVDRRRLPPPPRPALLALLPPQEQERLERLRRADDRDRFLLGRAVLRLLLAHELAVPPDRLHFGIGPHGKPTLARGPCFNLAHSGDLILLAFHPHRPVGVDVERHRPGLHWQPIARRCFPAGLCRALEALPEAQQLAAFHVHWCRLEARLKAHGTGFAAFAQEQRHDHSLLLRDLLLPQGYSGCLALL